MITGGGTTRKSREQGCFLFACGFVCLFAGVNSKSWAILVFTGRINQMKDSVEFKDNVVIDQR